MQDPNRQFQRRPPVCVSAATSHVAETSTVEVAALATSWIGKVICGTFSPHAAAFLSSSYGNEAIFNSSNLLQFQVVVDLAHTFFNYP